MAVSKLDVARRQLLAAIHLHWFLLEPIATYQLAANAAEVCDGLLIAMGRVRIKQRIQEVQGWSPKTISVLVNAPRNFAKHADKDPYDHMEDISSEDCDAIILTACVDYCIASGRSPIIFGVFVAWYASIYPEKTGEFFAMEAQTIFPNLKNAPRGEQIKAARSHLLKPVNSEMLNDRRNEMTDGWRWNDIKKSGQNFRTEE